MDLIRLAVALQVDLLLEDQWWTSRVCWSSDPSWSPLVLQEMTLANEENLPMFNRCGVMALVAAYLNFLSQMIANPPFCQHVSKVSEVPRFLGSFWSLR